MQRWEYKTIFVQANYTVDSSSAEPIEQSKLAELGDEGWELVTSEVLWYADSRYGGGSTVLSVKGIQYNFKRPK